MWSYRLVEHEHDEEKTLILCEVYFNSKREPYGYCEAKVVASDRTEALDVLFMMQDALSAPIVKQGDFVEDME